MSLFPSAAQLTANQCGVFKLKESNPRLFSLVCFQQAGTQSVLSVFTRPACIDSVAFVSNVNTYFLLISGTEAFKDIDYFLRQPTHFFFLHIFTFTFSFKTFCLLLFSFKLCEKGASEVCITKQVQHTQDIFFFVISLALILLVLNSSTQDFQILYVSAFRWCYCIWPQT